jgi:hypothetical protein
MMGMAVRVMRLPKAERICAAHSRLKFACPHNGEERLRNSNIGMASEMDVGLRREDWRPHRASPDQLAGQVPGAKVELFTPMAKLRRKRVSF